MAIAAVVDIARLDDGWILAPERYDPRRRRAENAGPCVGDFVHVRREVVRAGADATPRFLVFDTGDAKDGIMAASKPPVAGSQIRSAKKRIHPRQVVVSRLRPYLRQVAWVDPGLLVEQESSAGEREGASRQLAVPGEMAPSVELICSTEFFVLESADGASIAFLVAVPAERTGPSGSSRSAGRRSSPAIQRADVDDACRSGSVGRAGGRTLGPG